MTPGARWRDRGDDARCTQWIRTAAAQLAPGSSGGAYVNFVADPSGSERAAYGRNFDRLKDVKRAYDPTNLFHVNQNVPPG